jgi:hypothetical protein
MCQIGTLDIKKPLAQEGTPYRPALIGRLDASTAN